MVKRTPARGERGQILIVTVLSMTVLLGMAALSIDASFMYDRRNLLHAAADAAAKSVAAELYRNPALALTDAQNYANQQVIAHGLVPGPCGSTTIGVAGICLSPWEGPGTGPFAGVPGYVEATVSEVTPTFFGYVLGFVSATPGGRAVAGISASPNCLVAFNGLTVEAGATLTLRNGCGIVDGFGLLLRGGASIASASVSTAAPDCSGVPNCYPNSPPPTDPLASLLPPSPAPMPGCTAQFDIATDVTITPADETEYYCGMIIGTATVTFAPGVYHIAGPITAKTSGSSINLIGSGVTFFLAAGVPGGSFDLRLSTDVKMDLRAQTSGPYNGILFYQERGNPNEATFLTDTGPLKLSGVLYFPNALRLTVKNDFDAAIDCTLIVADNVTIDGNTDLIRECAALGGSPIQTVTVAE